MAGPIENPPKHSAQDDDVISSSGEVDEEEEENDEVEELTYKSLFDEQKFSSIVDMLKHDHETHNFNLQSELRRLDLDFYGAIKLINYLRTKTQTQDGHEVSNLISADDFQDEKYLQPTLEDDALLFSLDELIDLSNEKADNDNEGSFEATSEPNRGVSSTEQLEKQLSKLQHDFNAYKDMVTKSLDERWNNATTTTDLTIRESPKQSRSHNTASTEYEAEYFESYATYSIHETMLKDKARTNAYRDFIYGHKALFAGKTVLDVGCGTGILSFFAARAGAHPVHAVDNSAIIARAREIAAVNHFADNVHFHRGKIEDLHHTTPALAKLQGTVDVLVSEWMGYALLYEAMLDSVIAARDLYLRPAPSSDSSTSDGATGGGGGDVGGLMVPSHCTVHIVPCSDPDFVEETQTFWRDVYGFDYTPILSDPSFFTDAVVRDVSSRTLIAEPSLLKTFALQHVQVQDLDFTAPFDFVIGDKAESLDGFCLWFNAFFLPPPHHLRAELPWDVDAAKWRGPGVAFTTGPQGKELTHWQMVWLGINRTKSSMKVKEVKEGARVEGAVTYRKQRREKEDKRGLEIEIEWTVREGEVQVEKGQQCWLIC